jgi:hypothetical protein
MLLKYKYELNVYQYGMDTNNKVIDSDLIVSQVYNVIQNILKSKQRKKYTFYHFGSVFS